MSAASGGPANARPGVLGWLEHRLNLTELFSLITHFGLVYTPVDASRSLAEATGRLATEPVESLARWPRVLVLLTALVFGLEVVSGVLLAFYYQPTPEAAYESTRAIVRDVPFGWFLHQLHAWGAWVLVGVVALRLLRLFWDGLWQAPREILWLTAVALAWLGLQMDFTGQLLAWDSHSYWTAVRGMEVVFALPVVGPVLAFLLGGHAVSDSVLIRFYVLHIIVLPLWYALAVYLTFATLRRVGLAPARGAAPTTRYRDHFYTLTLMLLLGFGALVTLAVGVPFPFHPQADPYATPPGARPPWYMLAPYAVQQGLGLPAWVGGLVLVAISFAVPLLPFLARDTRPEGLRRVRFGGLGLFVLWVALGVYGALLERR
jgi:quinol-cytochrome oxidoreductase complex cytochrome b subunit